MKRLRILALACTLFKAQLLAQNNSFGRAPYAIQNSHYDCDALIESLKLSTKDIHYSWLYNTFNNTESDGLDCVKKLNSLPNTKLMEVHLVNEVCQRNNNCGPYEVLHGVSKKRLRRALKTKKGEIYTKLENYIKNSAEQILPTLNNNISCFISPSLESNLDKQSAESLLSLTKKYYGERCELVWNPVGNNKFGKNPIPGTIHELHGNNPKLQSPCIANLDGKDISLPSRKSFNKLGAISSQQAREFIKNYSHCEAAFLWIAEDNCLLPGPFKDPRERTNCATKEIQKEIISILE